MNHQRSTRYWELRWHCEVGGDSGFTEGRLAPGYEGCTDIPRGPHIKPRYKGLAAIIANTFWTRKLLRGRLASSIPSKCYYATLFCNVHVYCYLRIALCIDNEIMNALVCCRSGMRSTASCLYALHTYSSNAIDRK